MLALLRRFYVAHLAKSAGSEAYWRRRYEIGGDSGQGSYGAYATFKAQVLNDFVAEQSVTSVIEFGCGDGNQLTLARYPRYLGLDVSERAVANCAARFRDDSTKSFALLSTYAGERAELALSLDVIYHLIEDDVFEAHMQTLFAAGERFVIVYSSNSNEPARKARAHVRHRRFTDWVESRASGWELRNRVDNPDHAGDSDGSVASFFVYERAASDRTVA